MEYRKHQKKRLPYRQPLGYLFNVLKQLLILLSTLLLSGVEG